MDTQGTTERSTAALPPDRSAGGRPGRRPLPSRPVRVHLVGGAAQGPVLAAALRAAAPAAHVEGPAPAASAAGADVVLVVGDAGRELTGAELDRLRALPLDRPVLLALLKVDLYPQWRQVLAADVARLRALGVVAEPFPLPSLPAGAAAAPLPAVAALAERVLAAVPADAAGPAANTTAPDTTALDATAPDTTAPDTTAPDGEQQPPARSASGTRRRQKGGARRPRDARAWSHLLGDGCAAAASDVDFDLRTRVRAVLAEAERVIDTGDPGKNWSGFEAWLRTRLTFEADRTRALLDERTAALGRALSAHLGLPERAALRPPTLPPLPELFAHVPDRGDPTDSRRPLATRGRAVLVAAYGGILMTLLVPRLAGLQLPGWLIATVAVVAAVGLAAAALAGERKRQLDRRRTHAKSLVRHCTDGFLLSAGKFTKDGLRGAQQQLRDACVEHEAGRSRS